MRAHRWEMRRERWEVVAGQAAVSGSRRPKPNDAERERAADRCSERGGSSCLTRVVVAVAAAAAGRRCGGSYCVCACLCVCGWVGVWVAGGGHSSARGDGGGKRRQHLYGGQRPQVRAR
jgi:hypothetical protein